MTATIPNFKPMALIHINNRNMTGFFEPFLESLTFEDHMEGQADGVEVRLEDSAGRFLKDWYPVKGATVEAWIGYEGSPLLATLPCLLDEIEITGPPSTVTIRALSAAYTKGIRTKRSKAYVSCSLLSLATLVADTYGLTVVGNVPDIQWNRTAQHRETDLAFLTRLGRENGLVFSIKGNKLVFYDVEKIEAQGSILAIAPSDLSEWRFRDITQEGSVSATHFDSKTKQLISANQATGFPSMDQVRIKRRVESPAQAHRIVQAALRNTKNWSHAATLTLPGDPRLMAGGNVELAGFGIMDGLWSIRSAKHTLDRASGYKTELDARHISS